MYVAGPSLRYLRKLTFWPFFVSDWCYWTSAIEQPSNSGRRESTNVVIWRVKWDQTFSSDQIRPVILNMGVLGGPKVCWLNATPSEGLISKRFAEGPRSEGSYNVHRRRQRSYSNVDSNRHLSPSTIPLILPRNLSRRLANREHPFFLVPTEGRCLRVRCSRNTSGSCWQQTFLNRNYHPHISTCWQQTSQNFIECQWCEGTERTMGLDKRMGLLGIYLHLKNWINDWLVCDDEDGCILLWDIYKLPISRNEWDCYKAHGIEPDTVIQMASQRTSLPCQQKPVGHHSSNTSLSQFLGKGQLRRQAHRPSHKTLNTFRERGRSWWSEFALRPEDPVRPEYSLFRPIFINFTQTCHFYHFWQFLALFR